MEKILVDIETLNKEIINNRNDYINMCEKSYKMQMEKIVASIKMNEEIKFIRLAGPSSSGKTTTANLLIQALNNEGYNAKAISLDDFFVDRVDTPLWENGERNYETIEAINWVLFDECIHNLLLKGESQMPTYDFITGEGKLNKVLTLHDKDIIIIEGLHSLNPILDQYISSTLGLKVYLAPNVKYKLKGEIMIDSFGLRFFRRLIRDIYTRGTSPKETLNTWERVVLGEKLYIDPFKDSANFTINTSHPYEICIYKYIVEELKLNEISEFNETIKSLESIQKLDKKYTPEKSLLQEFVH